MPALTTRPVVDAQSGLRAAAEPFRKFMEAAQHVPDDTAFTGWPDITRRQITFGEVRALLEAIDDADNEMTPRKA